MTDLQPLLKPLTIKAVTIRNRVVSTAHAPAYADDAMPKERYQRYHEEKARGGIGMVMFGGSSVVSPDCPATFGQLSVAEDRIIPYFQAFSKRIHREGAAIMCQISHMGRRTRWDAGNWLPTVSPSAVREPDHRSFPKVMEDWDFRRITADFASAAWRCREGGLDGVELSFSGQHLVPQFFSPGTNLREDDYGGSLENRMRFGFEVLEAVRDRVGPDFIVGVRLSVDELIEDGLSDEDCLDVAIRLAKSGLVDFINTMGGQPRDLRSLAINMANMAFPVAPFLHLASAMKAEVEIPVLQAHRLSDVATAAQAVADGHLDLVGLTRPHMADPHIVRKILEGRSEDIRPCVGANYCIDRIYMGGEALCIQNPATGREATMPHVITQAASRKRVVVAGGGPAGLEAARVSAERGHQVVLFERADELGGQVNLASRATWRSALSGITLWLAGQVGKLGVEQRLGREADAEAVLAEDPDIVVVATGGRPFKGRIAGSENVVSSWDILAETVPVGENVLFFDDHGGHQGLSCAEFMAARGAKLELVTPERHTGAEMGGTNIPVHLRELYKAGVILSPDLRLTQVYPEGNSLVAVLQNEYSLEEEERLVDQVVTEHGTLPEDVLYFALKPQSTNLGELDITALQENRPQDLANNPEGQFQLFRVGDALASRNIHAAIYDSLRLAKYF